MKKEKIIMIFPLIVLLFCLTGRMGAAVQTFSSAGSYMEALETESGKISTSAWEYIKVSAHNDSARKTEKQRKILLKTVEQGMKKVTDIADYEGDASFKNAIMTNLIIYHAVLNEDFGKIVDMEEVAEQSYDRMEAYLLAKKKANEKLEVANRRLQEQEQKFADSHNIHLIMTNNVLQDNLKKSELVNGYYDNIYLIFFKSYKQELYLVSSLGTRDVAQMEQNRTSLIKFASEGSNMLLKILPFEGDSSLRDAGAKMLSFYKQEAEMKIPGMVDFFVKEESFRKIKEAFDLKGQKSRTAADVDQFNAKVKELNQAVNDYNQVNDELNKTRGLFLQTWNNTVRVFIDIHTPQ